MAVNTNEVVYIDSNLSHEALCAIVRELVYHFGLVVRREPEPTSYTRSADEGYYVEKLSER